MNKYILLKTVFNGDNYGSSLQAYALKTYLSEEFSLDCIVVENREIGFKAVAGAIKRKCINFVKSFMARQLFKDVWLNRLSKKSSVCKYNSSISARFKEFTSIYIQPEYRSYSDLKKAARSDYCVRCVCGSDQVWNPTGTTLKTMNFLSFSPKSKNISYAASIGANDIPYYNYCSFKKLIRNIRFVSVREEAAKKILKEKFDINATICVDPVALVGEKFWLTRMNKHYEGQFIFCYFLNRPSKQAEKEIEHYLDLGFEVKFLSRVNDHWGKDKIHYLDDVSPLDFPALVHDAKCILTDSFHGMMFSIVLHKNFLVFERDYQTSVPQNSRIVSLLDRLEIKDRFIEENSTLVPCTAMDYKRVDTIMNEMMQSSRSYLEATVLDESC